VLPFSPRTLRPRRLAFLTAKGAEIAEVFSGEKLKGRNRMICFGGSGYINKKLMFFLSAHFAPLAAGFPNRRGRGDGGGFFLLEN